ncbi:MAG TPA: hypothetical protein VH300_09280 [Thermoleophilaceae bacterium]|nr:hypothetical protein [Thermoleophilaceae bacterium]
MRLRIGLTAVFACLVLALVGAPAAGAATNGASPQATDAGPLYKMPITGVAKNGKQFKGSYGIYRFVVKNGKVWSVGTLSGRLKGRHVTRGNVMMPATLNDNSTTGTAQAAQTCTVLHLVLGPINLNLLGLHVTLGGGLQANQPIVLDITAEQGGGLLGDLLCGLTNSLSGQLSQLSGQLQQLATTLNGLIALLGGL